MKTLLRRLGLAGLALLLAAGAAQAADLNKFLPGPRLIDGSDLNNVVNRVNGMADGTFSGTYAGTFNGSVTAITGTFLSTGTTSLAGANAAAAALTANVTASSVNSVSVTGGITGTAPVITVGGGSVDTNVALVIAGRGTGAVHLGGTTAANGSLRVPTVASAVNQVEVSGAVATTGIADITIGGSGADTNAAISLSGKGTGATLVGGQTTTLAGLQVAQTASRVNDLLVTPGATGTSVVLDANSAGADTNAGITLAVKAAGRVTLGAITTCSGTTTATCQGQRFTASVTGLTTAAGGTSATAMTVTDATVTSSAVIVECNVNGYSGTGQPIITNVTPGTGSVSFQVTNIAASGSLNATVPAACVVF